MTSKRISFLVDEKNDRIMYFPIKYPNIDKMYEKAEKSFWTHGDINPEKDLKDWNNLSNDKKRYIKYVLSFFAASDILVNKYISVNFSEIFTIPEVRNLITFNMAIECVHIKVYTKIINVYCGSNQKEIDKIISDISSVKVIDDKIGWVKKWIGKYKGDDIKDPFNLFNVLVASMCIEGIFFSSSFLAIYWICDGGSSDSKKGQLKELGNSNILISRDEGGHAKLWIELIRMMLSKDFKGKDEIDIVMKKAREIIKEAVEIEKAFIDTCLEKEFIGMKRNMAKKYVEYVTDNLVKRLGMRPLYYTDNPFPFMEQLNMKKQANFFEVRALDYSKGTIHRKTYDKLIKF